MFYIASLLIILVCLNAAATFIGEMNQTVQHRIFELRHRLDTEFQIHRCGQVIANEANLADANTLLGLNKSESWIWSNQTCSQPINTQICSKIKREFNPNHAAHWPNWVVSFMECSKELDDME